MTRCWQTKYRERARGAVAYFAQRSIGDCHRLPRRYRRSEIRAAIAAALACILAARLMQSVRLWSSFIPHFIPTARYLAARRLNVATLTRREIRSGVSARRTELYDRGSGLGAKLIYRRLIYSQCRDYAPKRETAPAQAARIRVSSDSERCFAASFHSSLLVSIVVYREWGDGQGGGTRQSRREYGLLAVKIAANDNARTMVADGEGEVLYANRSQCGARRFDLDSRSDLANGDR